MFWVSYDTMTHGRTHTRVTLRLECNASSIVCNYAVLEVVSSRVYYSYFIHDTIFQKKKIHKLKSTSTDMLHTWHLIEAPPIRATPDLVTPSSQPPSRSLRFVPTSSVRGCHLPFPCHITLWLWNTFSLMTWNGRDTASFKIIPLQNIGNLCQTYRKYKIVVKFHYYAVTVKCDVSLRLSVSHYVITIISFVLSTSMDLHRLVCLISCLSLIKIESLVLPLHDLREHYLSKRREDDRTFLLSGAETIFSIQHEVQVFNGKVDFLHTL